MNHHLVRVSRRFFVLWLHDVTVTSSVCGRRGGKAGSGAAADQWVTDEKAAEHAGKCSLILLFVLQ